MIEDTMEFAEYEEYVTLQNEFDDTFAELEDELFFV